MIQTFVIESTLRVQESILNVDDDDTLSINIRNIFIKTKLFFPSFLIDRYYIAQEPTNSRQQTTTASRCNEKEKTEKKHFNLFELFLSQLLLFFQKLSLLQQEEIEKFFISFNTTDIFSIAPLSYWFCIYFDNNNGVSSSKY